MKDRWKILISSIVIASILTLLLLFLGFSFKRVSLWEYGLLRYNFYQTVDQAQSVRTSGNYLVGIDYSFITYPRGLLTHPFRVDVLTKDKSMINIGGLFVGQLIQTQIINLHFSYGPNNYFGIVTKTVEEIFRESIEQFLLTQIISQREQINSYVSSNVCLNIQSKYSFISCQYVSTGDLIIGANPIVLKSQVSIQQYFKTMMKETIAAQKRFNVYGSGGFNLIDDVETLNSQLFLDTTNLILTSIPLNATQKEVFGAAAYILDNPLLPTLDNNIYALQMSE